MHGLRSRGDMDFNEISAAIPVIEFCYLTGIRDLHALQKYQPNMYKSHMWYHDVPKGNAKHIIVVRQAITRTYCTFRFIFCVCLGIQLMLQCRGFTSSRGGFTKRVRSHWKSSWSGSTSSLFHNMRCTGMP